LFEILFLGTSASAPSVHRGLPAQVVKHDEHRFLVDCGEGTQRQILQSGLGFKKLNRLLITHSHLDHILGIGGLVSTYLRWEAISNLEIYAGASALERIHDLLFRVVIRGAQAPFPIRMIPIQPGVIIKENDFIISAFPAKRMTSLSARSQSTTAVRIATDSPLKKKGGAPSWQKKRKH